MDSKNAETLVKWYLRLNGYFTVDNFIVHAADDPHRISKGIIGNYTETDVLGIRNKYSKEVTGPLHIANDKALLDNLETRLDFLIGEVKTGNQNKPNKIWRDKNIDSISYLIRFAGFIPEEEKIRSVSQTLADKSFYIDSSNEYSIRLVVFSEIALNLNWQHVKNISLEHIVDFLVKGRGECWIETGIGIASIHYQWEKLINDIFEIANDFSMTSEDRKLKIMTILSEN